jgi:hypothetical protein
MDNETRQIVDELARAIFDVLNRNERLKQPAAIAVAASLGGGPRRAVRRTETVWQDYRPEARAILRG